MRKILEYIFGLIICIFELLIDIGITYMFIYLLFYIFGISTLTNILSYVILIFGIIYAINDFYEKYKYYIWKKQNQK